MDINFHYYATYLAARLAGMEPDRSQQLAYYCQTTNELRQDSVLQVPWKYQTDIFSPCVTGKSVKKHQGINNELIVFNIWPSGNKLTAKHRLKNNNKTIIVDPHNAELAFRYFPNLPVSTVDNNWIKRQEKPIETSCLANSEFSREMLNDVIYKSRYRSEIKSIDLALLGCRLFVYQQTWLHCLESEYKNKSLKDAFYWTLYAIECFLRATPIKSKRHWFTEFGADHKNQLDEQLTCLFALSGNPLEQEFNWLNKLSTLLAYRQQNIIIDTGNWQEGLRYRNSHLLEQAMLASKANQSLEIKSLRGFKKSDFFKINKAIEYHSDWFACQLKHKQVFNRSTSQSVGSSLIWRL